MCCNSWGRKESDTTERLIWSDQIGKTIAFTGPTFVGKVMSLLINMLSRLFVTFLLRSKHLLISWLQSPSAVRDSKRDTDV